MQAALTAALGAPQQVAVEVGVATDSPALRELAASQARQRAAEQIILQDPQVLQLMKQFRTARIVPGSIKPLNS